MTLLSYGETPTDLIAPAHIEWLARIATDIHERNLSNHMRSITPTTTHAITPALAQRLRHVIAYGLDGYPEPSPAQGGPKSWNAARMAATRPVRLRARRRIRRRPLPEHCQLALKR